MKKAIISTLMIMSAAAAVVGSAGTASDKAEAGMTQKGAGFMSEAPDDAQNGSGVQDADAERVYCLASVSKVYAAAAVMQLADRGLVDIDAPVTEYIPDFKMADPRYKDITVRMMSGGSTAPVTETMLTVALPGSMLLKIPLIS